MIDMSFITTLGDARCAKAKHVIEKVRSDFPELKVDHIDVTVNSEILQRHRMLAAPGIVLNGQLAYTGGLDVDAFCERLKKLSNDDLMKSDVIR